LSQVEEAKIWLSESAEVLKCFVKEATECDRVQGANS